MASFNHPEDGTGSSDRAHSSAEVSQVGAHLLVASFPACWLHDQLQLHHRRMCWTNKKRQKPLETEWTQRLKAFVLHSRNGAAEYCNTMSLWFHVSGSVCFICPLKWSIQCTFVGFISLCTTAAVNPSGCQQQGSRLSQGVLDLSFSWDGSGCLEPCYSSLNARRC